MSSNNITICPACGKNELREYYDSPHIKNETEAKNGMMINRYVFHVQYQAECKNKKCEFIYWFSETKEIL